MNHDEQLYKRSDEKMEAEILGTKELIQSVVPEASIEYYRAPAGNTNRHQRELVAEWGMKPIAWSVDTKDWQRPGVPRILAKVKRQLHNGGIILMHDSGGNRSETVAALKKLIPRLKNKGYQFVSPSLALAARQKPMLAEK
jgi:peptidoglycan/xylan/chitin deacetylase (PgdA/CDA1 family)